MQMRILIASIAVSVMSVSPALSAQFIRANEAGYFPDARKNLVVISDEDIAGQNWSITDLSGKTVISGTVGAGKNNIPDFSPKQFNYRIDFSSVNTAGEYQFRLGSNQKKIQVDANPYGSIITSSLRYLRSMRSGSTETIDREPAHMGDSSCAIYRRKSTTTIEWDNWIEDENGATAELKGGWYTAGNYAKMTSGVAYTSYYLLRAYETNPSIFEKKNSKSELVDLLDEARFGLAYLLKVMPNDKDFIIEVGGFDSENGTRLPHRDLLEGKRECYSAFTHTDMGYTVAALAIGARVFETLGKPEAVQYKSMAIKIFEKALSGNFEPVWLEKDYEQFKDESRYDNLLLGAMELYRLTNDAKYKTKAEEFS